MPRKKDHCQCGNLKEARSQACRACTKPYERSPEWRARMSERQKGPRPHMQGRKRPEHSATMLEWWTPERRQAMSLRQLERNPKARYHGLSARAAKRLVDAAGRCTECGHDGSESRLGVHHRDRNKQNQEPSNLQVLCHRCHMLEHAQAGETGWDVYHRRRKTSRN